MTKELEMTVDVFQRSLLRRVMNIFWAEKISNEVLYERTKTSQWSREIKKRRLKRTGHLLTARRLLSKTSPKRSSKTSKETQR